MIDNLVPEIVALLESKVKNLFLYIFQFLEAKFYTLAHIPHHTTFFLCRLLLSMLSPLLPA